METQFLILAPIVFLAHLVQTASGFGSMIVALALSIHFFSLTDILAILVPLNFLQSLYILIRYHSDLAYRLLFKKILPLMAMGLGIGLFISESIQGDALKQIFGLFITILSLYELLRKSSQQPQMLLTIKQIFCLLTAGIFHGIYACGGPALVYLLSRTHLNKSAFRCTLAAVWTILNMVLMVSYLQMDRIKMQHLSAMVVLLPMTFCGIAAGEWLYYRIDEHKFRFFIYCLLFAVGISLCVKL